jgi:hypothetical protein
MARDSGLYGGFVVTHPGILRPQREGLPKVLLPSSALAVQGYAGKNRAALFATIALHFPSPAGQDSRLTWITSRVGLEYPCSLGRLLKFRHKSGSSLPEVPGIPNDVHAICRTSAEALDK